MGIFQIFWRSLGYMYTYVHIDESLRTYIHIENVLVMELKVHTYIKVIPMYGYIHLVGTTIQKDRASIRDYQFARNRQRASRR